MSKFLTLAKVGDIEANQGRAYACEGKMIAIFNTPEGYFAIDDFCPHMGASLAEGYVEDGTVACPWHLWRFCLNDGSWLDNPKIKVSAYTIRVHGDEIQVELSDAPPLPGPT